MDEPDDVAMQPYEDPGWFPALKKMRPGMHRLPSGPGGDGVVILRILFLSLLLAPFLILFVLTLVIEEVGTPQPLLASGIVLLALAGAAAAGWTSRRELDVGNAGSLAATYRTNFFLGFALNEAPLLIGFVFSFTEDAMWPYLVAFPIYLVGMWLLAPTRRNLERKQEQVHRQGSMLSVGRALSSMPPR